MANSVTTTNPTSYLYNQNTSAQPVDNSLDKNAFLKILMTQLQNQDPTQPMDDTQFISQMAQFSSLEQMNNVATSMNSLAQINSMSYGSQLMGKQVSYTLDDGSTATGVVSGVQMTGGQVKVQIDNQLVDLTAITAISSESNSASSSSASSTSGTSTSTTPSTT